MLIDGDKAIEAIEHYIDEVRNIPMGASFKAGVKDGYYRAISIIKRLPSAERRGHWILSDYQNQEDVENGNYWYICSECSHRDLHAKTQEVPFCWWCGAKMEGERKNE